MELEQVNFEKQVKRGPGNPAWVKGSASPNPKGRKPGYSSFVDRAEYLATRYTSEQVAAICKDAKKLGSHSVTDTAILQRLYEASLFGGGQSMDRLLNRVLGMPDQYQRVDTNTTVNVMVQSALKDLRALDGDTLAKMKELFETKKEPLLIDNNGSSLESEGD